MRNFLHQIKHVVLSTSYIVSYCVIALIPRSKSNKRNLLLIRIDAVGDFILFTPCLKAYRELYPDYRITLLTTTTNAELTKYFPFVDEVTPLNIKKFTRNLFYRLHIMFILKKSNFEIAIYPTYSRTIHGDFIALASGSKCTIADKGNTDNILWWEKKFTDSMYTKLIQTNPENILELERNKQFVEILGGHVENSLPHFQVMENYTIHGINSKYIVIHPGSKETFKRWPIENFAEIIKRINQKYSVDVVVTGTEDESNLSTFLKISGLRFADLVGKTSLTELACVLKKSLLYIGNDTGTVHLASAVGTSTICIMGNGQYGRFFPYGNPAKNKVVHSQNNCLNDNWQCVQTIPKGASAPCIASISIDQVWAEITSTLG